MLSAIYESEDLGYLIFVIVCFIGFLLLVRYLPGDKNYPKKEVDTDE